VHFEHTGDGHERQHLAVFLILAFKAIGCLAVRTTPSTAAAGTPAAASVVSTLAVIPVASAATAATFLFAHVIQCPYLDPLQTRN
jgi:hypothetical protein